MWIPKGAALNRGRRLFEARRLLEEIRYLKNEKSFQNEIKNIFPCFTSAFFQKYKQTSKNVAGATLKYTNRSNMLKDKFKTEDLKRELASLHTRIDYQMLLTIHSKKGSLLLLL